MKKWISTVRTVGTFVAAAVIGVGSAALAAQASEPGSGAAPATPAASALSAAALTDLTTDPELVFTAITPCRIVDTRVAGGTFGPGVTRTVRVAGDSGFAAQGGHAGGCGIPAAARAVAATFTAVTPSASGYVRAWPADVAEPTATLLQYGTHSNAAGSTVAVQPTTAASLRVRNYGGPTHVIIDVTGYFAPQLSVLTNVDGTLINSSGRAVDSAKPNVGHYTVTWDRDVTRCSVQATAYASAHSVSAYNAGAITTVFVYDLAGAAVNNYVYVSVLC